MLQEVSKARRADRSLPAWRLAVAYELSKRGGQDGLSRSALPNHLDQAFQARIAPPKEYVLFGFEVAEKGAWRDIGGSCDPGHGYSLPTLFPVEPQGGVDQRLAGPFLLPLPEAGCRLTHRSSRASLHLCNYAFMQEIRTAPDPGVEANARLTGYAGVVLLALLGVESASTLNLRPWIAFHVFVGFALVPPLLLKLGAVGYRFVRYYMGEPRYRAAGPPQLSMRLLGPVLVVLTVVLFGSGIELWLFGYRLGFAWVPVHHASAYLWFVAIAAHVINYLRQAPILAAADWRDHLRGAFTRRSLVVASVVLGLALALAMIPFQSPFSALNGT
jgi:hypothetical protein